MLHLAPTAAAVESPDVELPASVASQICGIPAWKLARMARRGELAVTYTEGCEGRRGHRRYSAAQISALAVRNGGAA